jgi:hypothetical protein
VDPGQALRGFLDAFAVPPERIPADLDAQVGSTAACSLASGCSWCWTTRGTPAQVRPLLPGSPGCLALVTSRNHLTGLVAYRKAHSRSA